jgi:hypothetical protein
MQVSAERLVQGSLAAAAVVAIGWRWAASSMSRFAAALRDSRHRRKAARAEYAKLVHRVEIMHALAISVPVPGISRPASSAGLPLSSTTAASDASSRPASAPPAESGWGQRKGDHSHSGRASASSPMEASNAFTRGGFVMVPHQREDAAPLPPRPALPPEVAHAVQRDIHRWLQQEHQQQQGAAWVQGHGSGGDEAAGEQLSRSDSGAFEAVSPDHASPSSSEPELLQGGNGGGH